MKGTHGSKLEVLVERPCVICGEPVEWMAAHRDCWQNEKEMEQNKATQVEQNVAAVDTWVKTYRRHVNDNGHHPRGR